jgi:hypothetical protein
MFLCVKGAKLAPYGIQAWQVGKASSTMGKAGEIEQNHQITSR